MKGWAIAAAVLGFVAALLFLLSEPFAHAALAGAVGCLAVSRL